MSPASTRAAPRRGLAGADSAPAARRMPTHAGDCQRVPSLRARVPHGRSRARLACQHDGRARRAGEGRDQRRGAADSRRVRALRGHRSARSNGSAHRARRVSSAGSADAWKSGLPRSETLELTLPADASRSEVWSFVVSPEWNVEFEGLPAVMPEGNPLGLWNFEFHPRPGEKLALKIARPGRAEGATLAIDSAGQTRRVGKRSSNTTLELELSQHAGRPSHHQPSGGRARDGGAHRWTARADSSQRRRSSRSISCLARNHRVIWTMRRRRGLPHATGAGGLNARGEQRVDQPSACPRIAGSLVVGARASVPRCSTGRSSSCFW